MTRPPAARRTARALRSQSIKEAACDHWPILQVGAGLFAFHFFLHVVRVLLTLGDAGMLSLHLPCGPLGWRPAEIIFGLSLLYVVSTLSAIRATWDRHTSASTRWVCICVLVASLGSLAYAAILMESRKPMLRAMEQSIGRMERLETLRRERLAGVTSEERSAVEITEIPGTRGVPGMVVVPPVSAADEELGELRAQIRQFRRMIDRVEGRNLAGGE